MGERSKATYTTREKLFSQPLPRLATGSTSAIAGDIYLNKRTWQVLPEPQSIITVDISTLESDQSLRDQVIRDRFLESAKFPKAVFVLKRVFGIPIGYVEATTIEIRAEGELTIRDVTKRVVWEGTAEFLGGLVASVDTPELKFEDFGIPKIRIAVLEVEDWFRLGMRIIAREL